MFRPICVFSQICVPFSKGFFVFFVDFPLLCDIFWHFSSNLVACFSSRRRIIWRRTVRPSTFTRWSSACTRKRNAPSTTWTTPAKRPSSKSSRKSWLWSTCRRSCPWTMAASCPWWRISAMKVRYIFHIWCLWWGKKWFFCSIFFLIAKKCFEIWNLVVLWFVSFISVKIDGFIDIEHLFYGVVQIWPVCTSSSIAFPTAWRPCWIISVSIWRIKERTWSRRTIMCRRIPCILWRYGCWVFFPELLGTVVLPWILTLIERPFDWLIDRLIDRLIGWS